MRKTIVLVILITLFISALAFSQDATVVNRGAYIDIPKNHRAYSSVIQMTKIGVLEGQKVDVFNSGLSVTRYDLAIALSRLESETTEIDCKALRDLIIDDPFIIEILGDKIFNDTYGFKCKNC